MARVAHNVIVIPQDPAKDKRNILNVQRKIRVAYYARVSSDDEDQKTSFITQRDYYEEKIRQHSNWTLVKGYSDYAISGTNTFKRDEFNQMISDCRAGKIDLILTKSISRFARNTVDTLTISRDLQRIGVGIIFEKENINTADQDCEMLLTIFSSIAQEESRSISENVKWAFKAKFERGEIMLCTSKFLGYDRDEDGNLIINEEEARIVRLIAMLYLSGMSWEQIARDLERREIRTVTGKKHWDASTIGSILKNEKYAGNAIQGKSYTEDFLTKRRVKNHGERPKYKVIGVIPPILPLSVFVRIQEELIKRAVHRNLGSEANRLSRTRHGKYALSELLRCAECDSRFRRVTWTLGGKKVAVYRCKNAVQKGTTCNYAPTLRETDVERAVILALNEMKAKDTNDKVYSIVLKNVQKVIEHGKAIDILEIDEQMQKVKKKINELIEQGMNGFEDDPEVDVKIAEQAHLLRQLQETKKKINEETEHKRLNDIQTHIENSNMNIKEFDNAYMRKMIERINVFDDATIEIHFEFGGIVRKQLERASARR